MSQRCVRVRGVSEVRSQRCVIGQRSVYVYRGQRCVRVRVRGVSEVRGQSMCTEVRGVSESESEVCQRSEVSLCTEVRGVYRDVQRSMVGNKCLENKYR